MKRHMFWQFDHMGLGSLWQELSYILSFQEEEAVLLVHMDDYYFERLRTIVEDCFAPSRFPLHIERRETFYVKDAYERNNQDWYKTSDQVAATVSQSLGYSVDEVIRYNCNKRHGYWPLRFTKKAKSKYICFDLCFKDFFGVKPKHHYEHKDIEDKDIQQIKGKLEEYGVSYLDLNSEAKPLADVCETVFNSCLYMGREGGWSHVAHSAQIPFYPLMYANARVLRGIQKAHKGENRFLRALTEPHQFCRLLQDELLPYLRSSSATILQEG